MRASAWSAIATPPGTRGSNTRIKPEEEARARAWFQEQDEEAKEEAAERAEDEASSSP